jgi:signal transduction histidine kinase
MRQARRREIERLRVRIASDLHDDVGSNLWSITLLSRILAKQGSLGAEEQQDVNEINRIAVQTSNAIRDIIWLIKSRL